MLSSAACVGWLELPTLDLNPLESRENFFVVSAKWTELDNVLNWFYMAERVQVRVELMLPTLGWSFHRVFSHCMSLLILSVVWKGENRYA